MADRPHPPGETSADRASNVAATIQQQLENSEELFRVSLLAKNDEINQLNEEVKGNRTTLTTKVRDADSLNEELRELLETLQEHDLTIEKFEHSNKILAAKLKSIETKRQSIVHHHNHNNNNNNNNNNNESESAVFDHLCAALEKKLVVVQTETQNRAKFVSALKNLVQIQCDLNAEEKVALLEKKAIYEKELETKNNTIAAVEARIATMKGDLSACNEMIRLLNDTLHDTSSAHTKAPVE